MRSFWLVILGLVVCADVAAQDGVQDLNLEQPELAVEEETPEKDLEPMVTERVPVEAQGENIRLDIDESLVGKVIGQVELTCDLKICENPENLLELKGIAGLSVGQVYSSQLLETAQVRLAKTGFFESLKVTKRLENDVVLLEIVGKGATLIRDVRFDGLETPPFEEELRKVLIYRQGQAYKRDAQKAQTQLQQFRNLFEREGYFGTKIELSATPVTGTEHLVDLVFRIERGKARQVCDVGVRGNQAMTYADVRELLLSDGSFLSRRLRLYDATFTSDGFKRGQEALVEAYRRRGYFQARIVDKAVKVDRSGECVTLVIDILEGPKWDVIFEGVEEFNEEDIRDVLPFYESGYVDAEEIRRAERAIEQLYETRGHAFARVQGSEEKRDQLDRSITFKIQEGPKVEIREIVFEGLSVFTEAEVLEVMSTRVFALFDVGGYLQTDELLGDLLRIEALYREKGYHQALVRRFNLERISEGQMRVRISIDEGIQTQIARVEMFGNRTTTTGLLLQGMSSSPGAPFVPLQLRTDQTRMIQRYAGFGYPLARIETSCFLLNGEQIACEAPRLPRACTARSQEELSERCERVPGKQMCLRVLETDECKFSGGANAEAIRIRHEITEGPIVRVGARLLKGNFDTRASVIHREIELKRGDLLDTQKLIQGQGNLRQLNIFDSVSVETIGLDEAAQDKTEVTAALLISVEEASSSFLDFRSGVELREPFVDDRQLLLTGEAQYTNRNLFGFAQGIQPRVVGAIDTLQLFEGLNLDPTEGTQVDSLDYVFGAELSYSHPRFLKESLGIDKLYFTFGPFYLLDLLGIVNRQILREEWGLRSEFRKDLTEITERLFLKLGLEFKQIATFGQDGPVVEGERIFSPRRTVGKVEPDITLDRRDSPLNPKKGYLLRVQPTWVSGDALGQGGEGFFSDSFMRLGLSASYFIPFWRGDVVLGQGVRYGQVFPLAGRENPVSIDERFFLGGVRSLRGFGDDSVGPVSLSQTPDGGELSLSYNAELRYPLIPSLSVYGAVFWDTGLLVDCYVGSQRACWQDAFGQGVLDEVRSAAGLGLRALLLDQIPIILDYGTVLNRRPGERFGQFHVNVGYTFD